MRKLQFVLVFALLTTAFMAEGAGPRGPRQSKKSLPEMICREWVVGQLDATQGAKKPLGQDKLVFNRNGSFESRSHTATLTGTWKLDEGSMVINTTLAGMQTPLKLRILSISEKALVLATSSLGVEMILYLTPTPQRPASIILIQNYARAANSETAGLD